MWRMSTGPPQGSSSVLFFLLALPTVAEEFVPVGVALVLSILFLKKIKRFHWTLVEEQRFTFITTVKHHLRAPLNYTFPY